MFNSDAERFGFLLQICMFRLNFCSYDTIVAMDEAVRQQLLHLACEENSTDTEWCWLPSASPHPQTFPHMHAQGFIAALRSMCPDCDLIQCLCRVNCIESEFSGQRSPACCKACNMPFLRTASPNQARSQIHPKALVLSASWRRYAQRVCSLGAFSYYCGADELAARGGTALLQAELSRVLLPGLAAARCSGDISRYACCCALSLPVQIRDSTITRLPWCAVVGALFSQGAEAWPRLPMRQAARHPHHTWLRGFHLHALVNLCVTESQRTHPHALHIRIARLFSFSVSHAAGPFLKEFSIVMCTGTCGLNARISQRLVARPRAGPLSLLTMTQLCVGKNLPLSTSCYFIYGRYRACYNCRRRSCATGWI